MLVIKLETAGQLFRAMREAERGYSYDACEALLEYYDRYGEDLEFDPVALSGDWIELAIEEAERETGMSFEELRDETIAYELDNGNILYLNF